mgnify:CR=1 FL=1
MKLGLRHIAQPLCVFLLTLMASAETVVRAPLKDTSKQNTEPLGTGLIGLEVYPKAVSLETAADFHRSEKKQSDGAKQIKLADKACDLKSIPDELPIGWSWERQLEYFNLANAVCQGLYGGNG